MEGIELLVCRHTDPNTVVEVLEGRKTPKLMDETGGVGGGSFQISRNNPKVVADPTLLAYRNVIKVKVNGQIIGGFIILKKTGTLIGSGENAEAGWEISGPGFLQWLDDADVKPYGGLKKNSIDTRSFSFASEQGDWYNPSDWTTPVVIANVLAAPWPQQPAEWPTAPNAKWVWGTAGAPAPGANFFRYEFTTTGGTKKYSIFAAGDNYFSVYVDGTRLMISDPRYSASAKAVRIDIELTDGDHVLALQGQVKSGSKAGVIAALFHVDGETETLITATGDAGWKVNDYPATPPGWTPGEILLTLFDEAEDRGVRFPTWLIPNFTADLDSHGNAWPEPQDWTFDIAESLLSVLGKITEIGLEAWIDYEEMTLNLAPVRGIDLTEDPNSVVFRKGHNLKVAKSEGVGKVKNNLSVKSADGWLVEDNTSDPSIDVYGTLEGSLEANVPENVAKQLVEVVFAQRATAEEGATYEIVVVPGAEPKVDFDTGDWVMAPNDLNILVPRKVVSLAVGESEAGRPVWTIEFDTIFRSEEDRINKFMNKTGGGGLSSSFNNGGGTPPPFGGPIIVTPGGPTVKIPKAPTGLVAESTGYWSADGVTAYSELHLEWNAVTENTDETPTTPLYYEVWGHLTDASDESSQLFGTTSTPEAIVRPFIPGQEWTLTVKAFNDEARSSSFSASIDHTFAGPTDPLDAPDDPTTSSSMGLLVVNWNGLLQGNPPPSHFRYVYAKVGPTGGTLVRTGATLARDGRSLSIPGLTVGDIYDVELYAVDGAGIESPASGVASQEVIGVDLSDLDESIQDAIDAAAEAAREAKSSTNLLEDPSFELNTEEFWDWDATRVTNVTTDPRTGLRHLRIEADTADYDAVTYLRTIECDPGEDYMFRVYGKAEATTGTDSVDNGLIITVLYGANPGSLTEEEEIGGSPEFTTGEYESIDGIWHVPEDVYCFTLKIVARDDTGDNVYYIDDVRVFKMTGTTLLVDGAVVADKIAADSIAGVHIQANEIDTVHMRAESITGVELAVDSIETHHLTSHVVTSDKIEVGAIEVQHISGGVGAAIDLSDNDSIVIMSGLVGDVQTGLEGTQGELEVMQTYFSVRPEGAVVSTPSSPLAVRVSNDSIDMLENGNIVSFWNSGQMNVNSIVIQEAVLGTNHKIEQDGDSTLVRWLAT